jgi:membrane associated rhomboid family serine protease
MEIHLPDPAFTNSRRSHENFRLAVRLALGFVALLWAILLLGDGLDLQQFGVRPREWQGLIGIFAAPLLHGGFKHLLDNSIPLVVVGTAMLYLYPKSALRVLPAVYLGPGIAVWLFAKGGIHIGASGLVYGLVAYVFVAGLIRHDRRAIAASMLVAFMYGTLAWGVTPIQVGMSWETHLAAALIGAAMAVLLRRHDVPPRVRYDWEGETGNDYDGESVRTDSEWPGANVSAERPESRVLH